MSGGELLTYDDLRRMLGGSKPLSLRQAQRLVARYGTILRPVRLGYRTVRFRPARVEALAAHLGCEPKIGLT